MRVGDVMEVRPEESVHFRDLAAMYFHGEKKRWEQRIGLHLAEDGTHWVPLYTQDLDPLSGPIEVCVLRDGDLHPMGEIDPGETLQDLGQWEARERGPPGGDVPLDGARHKLREPRETVTRRV